MKKLEKGPAMVLGPEEGASYWQPGPHHGYMTVKLGPHNLAQRGNNCAFSMGIQVMPPGCHVRAHGHAQNDEVFYILEGTGRCVIDRLQHEIARVAQQADVRQRMEATGNEALGSTPEEFDAKFKADVARFRKIVQDARIPSQD